MEFGGKVARRSSWSHTVGDVKVISTEKQAMNPSPCSVSLSLPLGFIFCLIYKPGPDFVSQRETSDLACWHQ